MKIVKETSDMPWFHMGVQQTHLVLEGEHLVATGDSPEDAATKAALRLAGQDQRVLRAYDTYKRIERQVANEVSAQLLVDWYEQEGS